MLKRLLSLLFIFGASPVYSEQESSLTFADIADVRLWADKNSFGNRLQSVTYNQKQLLLVFLSHTSGVYSSEPFVFQRIDGKWTKVFQAATCPCVLEASVQESFLVLKRTRTLRTKIDDSEYLRFNLDVLP